MGEFIKWALIGYAVYWVYRKVQPMFLSEEEKQKRAEEQARVAEEQRQREAEQRAAAEKAAKEERERRAEAAKETIASLTSCPDSRTYFSYSLVNETSKLYLMNPATNEVVAESETNLAELYEQGWCIADIDKTGKSAQLESFNMVVRLRRA